MALGFVALGKYENKEATKNGSRLLVQPIPGTISRTPYRRGCPGGPKKRGRGKNLKNIFKIFRPGLTQKGLGYPSSWGCPALKEAWTGGRETKLLGEVFSEGSVHKQDKSNPSIYRSFRTAGAWVAPRVSRIHMVGGRGRTTMRSPSRMPALSAGPSSVRSTTFIAVLTPSVGGTKGRWAFGGGGWGETLEVVGIGGVCGKARRYCVRRLEIGSGRKLVGQTGGTSTHRMLPFREKQCRCTGGRLQLASAANVTKV